jgi:hypothetical protein
MKEEEKKLGDIYYRFNKLERDRDKHAKTLHECKVRQYEFKRLKTEVNKIKKDYRNITLTDLQFSEANFEVEQAQAELHELNLQKSIMTKNGELAKRRNELLISR